MFWGQKHYVFSPTNHYIKAVETISEIPEEFLKKHALQKIFNSFRSEGLGLNTLIEKFTTLIQNQHRLFNCLYIMLDNSGLVTQLIKADAQRTTAFIQHREIFDKLASFEVPYFFRWLPRESMPIKKADALGRLFEQQNNAINPELRAHLEQHFSTSNNNPSFFLIIYPVFFFFVITLS